MEIINFHGVIKQLLHSVVRERVSFAGVASRARVMPFFAPVSFALPRLNGREIAEKKRILHLRAGIVANDIVDLHTRHPSFVNDDRVTG